MSRVWQWIKQGGTCIGAAFCRGITLVFDGVAAAGTVLEKTARAVGDFGVRMFQRVRKTKVAQKVSAFVKTVWGGIQAIKKAIDIPETAHSIWIVMLWLWTFSMSLACSSAAAPWATTTLCVTGVTYFSLLVATTLFTLFLIGTLARPDRS